VLAVLSCGEARSQENSYGNGGATRTSENSVMAKFVEFLTCELPRISIPRTPVNKGIKKGRSVVPRPSVLSKSSTRC